MRIGFEHEGLIPAGSARSGGGNNRVHSALGRGPDELRPDHRADLGYVEQLGIDDENRHDPKEYRDDYFKGQTDSFLGSRMPFTTKITITGPADFTINSVGTKTADTVKDGPPDRRLGERPPGELLQHDRRPLAGPARRGDGHVLPPGHPYNIAEMGEGLDAARRYYSQWFSHIPGAS